MAKQATAQGIAYQQLRPTEGGNLGAIVEEHIRYWSKFDADEKAKKEALAAQQREYERKVAESQGKRFDDLSKGIGLADSEGYFREQIVKQFESEQPLLYNLAKQASEGNTDAKIQLDNKLQFYKEATTLDKKTTVTAKKYAGGRDNEDYNSAVDESDLGFLESLGGSFYALKDGKVIIRKSLDSDETEEISVQDLSNKLESMQGFSGKFSPTAFATEIGSKIKLDDRDGNQLRTPAIRREAITQTVAEFKANPKALRSYAFISDIPREELGNLNEDKINELATKMYDEHIESQIQQRTNYLSNEVTKANLDDKNKKTTLELITDESKNPAKNIIWKGKPITLKEGNVLVQTKGQKVADVIDTGGNTITQPILFRSADGQLHVAGKTKTKVVEPVLDDKGNPVPKISGGVMIPDGNGGYVMETKEREVVKDVVASDDVTVDTFVTQITNPKTGEEFKNVAEATRYINEISPLKQSKKPTKSSNEEFDWSTAK